MLHAVVCCGIIHIMLKSVVIGETNMIKNLRGSAMLLLAAIIWGTAFVAQSEGMHYVEPFTYNGIRTLIGGIVLVPVIMLFKKANIHPGASSGGAKASAGTTVIGGIVCGSVLFTASSFQQVAISMTTAGKAGFITALYIVIVPLIEFVLYRKSSKRIWLCVFIAITGFYLLCIKEGFSISKGDLLMLVCAFFFAGHIMVIDRFLGKNVDGMLMACIQFFVSGTLGIIAMFMFENPQIDSIMAAKGTILYAGILSSGVAYTLQIIGQRHTAPTVATLLMSLESVFAAISGWLILHESMSAKEGTGCLMVFMAVILAQLNLPEKKKLKYRKEKK